MAMANTPSEKASTRDVSLDIVTEYNAYRADWSLPPFTYNLRMPISAARVAAFEILLRVEAIDAYASELLHSARFAKLSSTDHGLLTELVMGALRWRSVLDAKIAEYASQSLAKLDPEVLASLRLGAYQLLFLDRIPEHAVVSDSVELVKLARKKSAAGMVNAVLRRVALETTERPHFPQKRRA